jgi:organic hydroperoxide reductase OsmC/OhrA
LFFLSLAAKRGFIIDQYTDGAVGYLGKSDDGKMVMTRVVLKPDTSWSGEKIPSRKQIQKMHHRAHDLCFIANSVTSEVVLEIVE